MMMVVVMVLVQVMVMPFFVASMMFASIIKRVSVT
jgi:hypothetical protein